MENIFFEKSYIKYAPEATPRHFDKKWKLNISLDYHSEIL